MIVEHRIYMLRRYKNIVFSAMALSIRRQQALSFNFHETVADVKFK
jgi:hypothetical protein